MDINMIIQLVGAIVIAIIAYGLVPACRTYLTARQQADVVALVNILVAAAEQTMKTNTGAEKKAQVEEWLIEKGIEPEDCQQIIEQAVYQLKQI